jgi:PAS domain S-box-containing protein
MGDSPHFVNFTTDDGLGSNVVSAIFQDSNGLLWFAGWAGGGITRYDGSSFHRYTTDDGLVDDRVICIIEDPRHKTQDTRQEEETPGLESRVLSLESSALWIGTAAGISYYNGSVFRNYTAEDGLSGSFIQRIVRNSRGQIWIATLGGGISKFDGGNFQALTTEDGLPSNCATGIIEDLGSPSTRISGRRVRGSRVAEYEERKGEDADGNMIISTYRGICRYVPDYKTPPLIRIDEVDADRIYKEPGDIQISRDISSIRIRYHGISFKTKKMRYNYILEGYDEDWKATWDEEARYENLPIGEYTFKVIAINRDLVYSETPAELRVSVIHDPRDVVISELEKKVRERTKDLLRTQSTLRDAKDYIDNVVKSMADTLIVVNPDGTIRTVNQATLDLLGYREHELIGKPIEMILAEEESLKESGFAADAKYQFDDLIERDFVLDIEKGFIRDIENIYLSKDGTKIPMLFSGSIMQDDNEVIQGIVCVAQDITERKQIQEALKRERDFTSAVVETAGALVVVLDPQGRIVRFNRACEQTTGYSFHEVRNQHFWDLFLIPEEVERVKAVFEELRAGHFPNEAENYWVTKDGGRRLIAWSNTALLDNDGPVEYIISTGIDITERKQAEEELREHRDHLEQLVQERTEELTRAVEQLQKEIAERVRVEEALRESEEKYRTIFETTGTAAIMIDEDTTISLANAEFEKLSGYSKEEIEGKQSWTQFIPKGKLEKMKEYHRLRRIDPNAAPRNYESQFIHREGNIRDCLLTVTIIPGTKKSIGFIVDITERKEETERIQAAKMESLRQLVAGVTHQMNNPIGAILSDNDVSSRAIGRIKETMTEEYPQEIKKEGRLVRALAALESMNQVSQIASEEIAKIVADLQRFVRLDEAEWQFADIHEGMDNVIALMGPEFSSRIRVTKDYGDIPRIHCSPSSLNQVFMSLFKNASEAIEGKGEINIRTFLALGDPKKKITNATNERMPRMDGHPRTRRPEILALGDPRHVEIEISDTGKGIPADDMDKIFDPGFTTKGVRVGVGLGLPICYKIVVDEHKGRIDVSSEPGKGTTFTITLPQYHD